MKTKIVLFSVILLAIASVYSCKKANSVAPSPLSYVSKMGGLRNWTGMYSSLVYNYIPPSPPIDTLITNISETFAITIINDTTISVPDYGYGGYITTLYCNSAYITADTMIFVGQDYNVTNLGMVSSVQITYNYKNNNILYQESGEDQGGDSWGIILHTP